MSTPATPREGGPASTTRYRHRFANADYDEATGELKVDGQVVAIEPRPLRLLAELLRHVNEAVTKEELLDAVWESRITVDNVLTNAVNKLRTALGKAASAHIVSLPRVGYRLVGPVERTVVGQPDLLPLALRAGQPVPGREAFILQRTLGSAGRGNVWLAQHAALTQGALASAHVSPAAGELRVFKFAADADGLRALKREFTLFRVLKAELGDGPGFAQVIDANFAEAPYHLECAYGGPDLLAWAAEGGRLQALSVPERLALFLPIARAVVAAHSVGVLHKDLKPANVLIGGQPGAWLPVLTDFGSGHAIDPERLRQLGVTAMGLTLTHGVSADTTLGTAMYLAPEVQGGQASTVQSDLYALGLMLYQLLAGDLRRPMSTGWQRDIGDELLCEDIAAATEGQPQARLGSVSALVERLLQLEHRAAARLLSQQAHAQAARAVEEQRQRRARRPWLIGGSLALVLGLLVSGLFGRQTVLALRQAELQMARANAINAFMSEDLLNGASLVNVKKGNLVSMPELLRRASTLAAVRFKAQPQTESEVRSQLGRMFYSASMNSEAVSEQRHALKLLQSIPSNADVLRQIARVRLQLANVLAYMNGLDEARSLIELAKPEVLGHERNPSHPLAEIHAQTQFAVLVAAEQYEAAATHARVGVELADQLPADRMESRFGSRFMLGDVLYRLGKLAEAEALYTDMLSPKFDESVVGRVQLLRARINRAQIRIAMNRPAGVERDLIEGRDGLIEILGRNENHVAVADGELGNLYLAAGDFIRAEAAFRSAHEIDSLVWGENSPNAKVGLLNLAIVELNIGRAQVALDRLSSARPWFVEHMAGELGPIVQSIDFQRARALTALGRVSEAMPILARLEPQALEKGSPSNDWTWILQAEKGKALLRLGKTLEARTLLHQAIKQMEGLGTSTWTLNNYRRALDKAQ